MRATCLAILLVLSGCEFDLDVKPDDPTDTDPTTTTDPDPTTTVPTFALAGDVSISKVSVFQAVEVKLFENGAGVNNGRAPVIAGRDALVRVFVDPENGFSNRRLEVHLIITSNDGTKTLVADQQISGASADDDLSTTINIDVDGSDIKLSSEFTVELREVDASGPGGGSPVDTTFDSAADLNGGLPTEGSDDVTMVIIPIEYNADGSGRLPDTSDSHVNAMRDAMYGMFPASNLTIRVDPPMPWNQAVNNYNQWANLLDAVSALRDSANEAPNTYYYGLFNPDETLNAYCNFGCLLGLSQPGTDPTDDYLKASIGLGFRAQSTGVDTLVHEVGHAMGRFHSDCGGAYGTDPNYPYNGANIGTWGYDLTTGELVVPTGQDRARDVMGYCVPYWVSDYTFEGLREWIDDVKRLNRSVPRRVSRLRLDDQGVTSVVGSVWAYGSALGADPVDVALFDEAGEAAGTAQGWMAKYHHIPFYSIEMDRELAAGWTAKVLR